MKIRRILPRVATCALGLALSCIAHAATITGNFTSDDQVATGVLTINDTETFNISTTSYATGGFLPVLTLFDFNSGLALDTFGANFGPSDASLVDTLGPGTYLLALSEFPNVAIGNLSDGFLFTGSPNITGDICGVAGGQFLDTISCTQRTSAYSVNITSAVTPVAATPEPSSWLLLVSGLGVVAFTARRRQLI